MGKDCSELGCDCGEKLNIPKYKPISASDVGTSYMITGQPASYIPHITKFKVSPKEEGFPLEEKELFQGFSTGYPQAPHPQAPQVPKPPAPAPTGYAYSEKSPPNYIMNNDAEVKVIRNHYSLTHEITIHTKKGLMIKFDLEDNGKINYLETWEPKKV